MLMQEFFQMLQYFLATNSRDIVVGDFDYLLIVSENEILNNFTQYPKIISKLTQYLDH